LRENNKFFDEFMALQNLIYVLATFDEVIKLFAFSWIPYRF